MSSKKLSRLPMNALNEIPKPNSNAQNITALVKKSGHVTGYQLSGENVMSKSDAIQLARQGGIAGVGIANRKGSEYLKSLPDGNEKNNLSNLPSVTG